MVSEQRDKLRYFIASFALKHYDTDPIEGGKYPVGMPLSRRSLDIRKGDIMLLYCCGDYPGYYKEAPAVGIVTDIEGQQRNSYTIRYRCLFLDEPVPRDFINESLNESERRYFRNPGKNYLFPIEKKSFENALRGKCIRWP